MSDLLSLLKAFAGPVRIKVAGALVGQPMTADAIARATGLPFREVMSSVYYLQQVGLVVGSGEGAAAIYTFQHQPIIDAMKELAAQPPAAGVEGGADDFERKVLTTFISDGKLTAIPAQQKKRDVILRFLAGQFEIERMYDEKEVNGIIARFHPDTASLRRYLVDGGFLQRQIVREVSADALVAGEQPEVRHRNMYWRPKTIPEPPANLDSGS